MNHPYCPNCRCIIAREGEYCQLCRDRFSYKSDECICYIVCPQDCTSKLTHYCCCMNALDIDDCKAEEHSCICNTRKDIIEKCRGDNHDMLLR